MSKSTKIDIVQALIIHEIEMVGCFREETSHVPIEVDIDLRSLDFAIDNPEA